MTTQERSLGLVLYIALLLAGSWLLTSCAKSVVIESTTSWEGAVGTSTLAEAEAATLAGSGNTTIPATAQTVCWRFRKTTATGGLRVYLREASLLGADRMSEGTTYVPYGIVAGCAGGGQ